MIQCVCMCVWGRVCVHLEDQCSWWQGQPPLNPKPPWWNYRASKLQHLCEQRKRARDWGLKEETWSWHTNTHTVLSDSVCWLILKTHDVETFLHLLICCRLLTLIRFGRIVQIFDRLHPLLKPYPLQKWWTFPLVCGVRFVCQIWYQKKQEDDCQNAKVYLWLINQGHCPLIQWQLISHKVVTHSNHTLYSKLHQLQAMSVFHIKSMIRPFIKWCKMFCSIFLSHFL